MSRVFCPLLLLLFSSFGFAQEEVLAPHYGVFDEPEFPGFAWDENLELPEGVESARTSQELNEWLEGVNQGVLIWRHGPFFPRESWAALHGFLSRGGSLLHAHSEPLTRPVVGAVGQRKALPRMVSWLKALRLNQSFEFSAGASRQEFVWSSRPSLKIAEETQVFALEPRLSDTKDFKNEDGSPGTRDALVKPISHLYFPDGDPRFPDAAGSVMFERLRGTFAGGRWVLRTLSSLPEADEWRELLALSAEPPRDFRIDPTFGCFYEGERPSAILRMHRPRAFRSVEESVSLTLLGPEGLQRELEPITLTYREHASQRFEIPQAVGPGLFTLVASVDGSHESTRTGFWIYDQELFLSGDEISFDSYTMRRNGEPSPVVGTTVMSQTVHRKFLFEPNAAQWDQTFSELASIGCDLVRTGIWSAYRKISLDPNHMDEAFLRSLQAYYLSATRHGVAVIFTFFAFVPESFGGENPYWDPRAREGQAAYIRQIVTRFRGAKQILWDLINEPSYSSPDKLWFCRPHGDGFETDAFLDWLENRYQDQDSGISWEERVRARWRLIGSSPLGLPTDDDFVDVHVFSDRRPYRAKEFIHFAQDAFSDWVVAMSSAIRDTGAKQSITVGQDEGGLIDRPSPLMHHPYVDYTSLHSWWFNDRLLWDGAMAKAPGKPLLVSETGVMNREHLSGEPFRSPEQSARLLSRKIASAFASRAFGIIQWCYEVNPFMDSDNEVAIGMKRVDGSYKPEHRVFREFAQKIAAHRKGFASELEEPEITLVLPSGDLYSPRGLQAEGTHRALSLLQEQMGLSVQVVSEYRASLDLGKPKLIILPACRGLCETAWQAILRAVEDGAILQCCGWFECDDAGLPMARLGLQSRPLAEFEGDAGVRFSRDITESWMASEGAIRSRFLVRGKGGILHHPLPLEWASRADSMEAFYRSALDRAKIQVESPPEGLSLQKLRFGDRELWVAINKNSQPREFIVDESHRWELGPGGVAMAWVTDGEGTTLIYADGF